MHRLSPTRGVFPPRSLGLLVRLGCAVLVLASPAMALPKSPSPITIPTLPKLRSYRRCRRCRGSAASRSFRSRSTSRCRCLRSRRRPAPDRRPAPTGSAPRGSVGPVVDLAFPGLDGLPVPLSADGLAAAAAADGEQLAPTARPPALPPGIPRDADLGFAPAAGNRPEPAGNPLFLATSASVTFAYECLSPTRNRRRR